MENNKSSCEIVYKQTHVFSIDASQLLVLVKIFFFWQGGGVGHTKKKFCGMWDLKLPDQGSTPSRLHWKHRVLTAGPPGKSLLVRI